MKIRVLGCYGGQLLGFRLTSFLVDQHFLLDAGSPTEALSLKEQHEIRHVFISHTHLDHIKDLAFLADNRSMKRLGGAKYNRKLYVYSLQENLNHLQQDFLNDHIWPDFTRIPSENDPILEFRAIEEEKVYEVEGLKIVPIRVNHPVPCTGFLLSKGGVQFLYTADTGHTERIWEIANQQENLKGVILDCSFPSDHEHIARISGHLTTHGIVEELAKFRGMGNIPVYLYHMKPEALNSITAEIESLSIPNLRMLTQVDELLI